MMPADHVSIEAQAARRDAILRAALPPYTELRDRMVARRLALGRLADAILNLGASLGLSENELLDYLIDFVRTHSGAVAIPTT